MSRVFSNWIALVAMGGTFAASSLLFSHRSCGQQAQSATTPNVQIVEENGVRYQVARSRVLQPVRDYRHVDQQQYYYQQRYRTELRPTTQTRFELQTTYECVPRLYDWWRFMGVFGQPYVAYGIEPRTRWVRQTQNVNVAMIRPEVVPYTRTVRMAVPYLRFEEREQVSKLALGPARAASQPQIAAAPPPSSSTFQPATARPPVASRPSLPSRVPRPTYIPASPARSWSPPIVAAADPYTAGSLAQTARPSATQLAPTMGRDQSVTGDTFQTRPWSSSSAAGRGAYPQSSIGGYSATGTARGSVRYGGVARLEGDPPRYGTSLGGGIRR